MFLDLTRDNICMAALPAVQKRVVIIGAGAAGLAMCKALVNEPEIQPFVFEKSPKIGGAWVYSKDGKWNGNHTAMYKNLRWFY